MGDNKINEGSQYSTVLCLSFIYLMDFIYQNHAIVVVLLLTSIFINRLLFLVLLLVYNNKSTSYRLPFSVKKKLENQRIIKKPTRFSRQTRGAAVNPSMNYLLKTLLRNPTCSISAFIPNI